MSTGWFTLQAQNDAPKFERIVNSVTEALHKKELKCGQLLPSISRVSERYNLARETVAKAYRILKARGIIRSVPSKGYYVSTGNANHAIRVFLLLSVINQNNKQIYETLREELGERAVINVFFHNFNADVFQQLILDNLNQYGVFVVKPFDSPQARESLARIPPDKLILVDRHDRQSLDCAFVGQSFDKGLEECLEANKKAFEKYAKKITLIFSDASHHPEEIQKGLAKFCRRNGFRFSRKQSAKFTRAAQGEIYFVITDDDLAVLLASCEKQGLKIGRDVGIVSYNDSALKPFIAGGLTVLSTDFKQMGSEAARCILEHKQERMVIPTRMIMRSSL